MTKNSTKEKNGTTKSERRRVSFKSDEIDYDVKKKNGTYSEVSTTKKSPHKISEYVIALRPWSFPATLMPVGLGCVLYVKYADISLPCFWTLFASCLTVLCVHAAGNLVNTYVDFKKGVDSQKSDDRTLVDHIFDLNDIATMATVCYCFGCVGFAITVYLSPASLEELAFVFFGGLSSSFLYTGGIGLKYIALGDILIFITFGPIVVLFTYLSQGGHLSYLPLLYAVPLALNTEAILHSNNTRDMETDHKSGITTVAIMLGKTGSYVYFVFLLFAPFAIYTYLVLNVSRTFLLPLLTMISVFGYEREFRLGHLKNMPQKLAKLNLIMGSFYLAAVALTPRSVLPGF